MNGDETPILLDDFLPTFDDKPAFASSSSGELWTMLLEKAWAKLHGSYARVEGGLNSHASLHLEGTPAFDISHELLESHD